MSNASPSKCILRPAVDMSEYVMDKPEAHMRRSVAELYKRMSRMDMSTSSEPTSPVGKMKKKKMDKQQLEHFKQELSIDDHLISIDELVKRYKTDLVHGLSTVKALQLLEVNGPNLIHPPKGRSRFSIFCEFMFMGFSMLLWMGVILCVVGFTVAYMRDNNTPFDQLYLAFVILWVIIVTGLFGFYQESANNSIMESFRKMIPKTATVIRDGQTSVISSELLVVGDVVCVDPGACIPADMRMVETLGLKVDNSSITGESKPQMRTVDTREHNPLEAANLVFYGTNAVEGLGKGVVISTGDNTLMGHIAGLTQGLIADETPIKKELRQFIKILTIFAIVFGSLFFMLAMSLGYNFFDSFVYFIAIVVANVPEGLLVTMTACLTLTAKKMAKKNCLCKNLHAIETLGSTSVICSDKTGTLTQNRMTVSHMFYYGNVIDILSPTYKNQMSTTFVELCRTGMLCSRAEFMPDQEGVELDKRLVNGDASESAVLKCMERLIGNVELHRQEHQKVFEIPFNSSNKYQLSIHKVPGSDRLLLVMKGAPERILERCDIWSTPEGNRNLSERNVTDINTALVDLGIMGERVLGFADTVLPAEYTEHYEFDQSKLNFPMTGLRFLGFMSMIDPPRPGVMDAVESCRNAGIRVIMVTGDHPVTAMAIAKKIGIISPEEDTIYDLAIKKKVSVIDIGKEEALACKAAVVTGTNLRTMDPNELRQLVKDHREIVFARTSPQQKLQVVEAFQMIGEIVAVTGDGVNDSPALKKADIGVAMGIAGSEVSKEAADMVILDDNFASIVVGIEEGRLIFDNLKKSISYMMTSNVPEMLPFLMHVLLGMPQALTVMAILVVDVGTDLWPGISLAYEMAEADIMMRKPRNPLTDRLVSWKLILFTNLNIGMIQACAGFACYFYIMSEHGFSPMDLLFIRQSWYSSQDDLLDSVGQEWTRYERSILERKGVAGFFLAIVMTQVADCVICKTRRLSVFKQGMKNTVMNLGIAFELVIGVLVVYCPHVNDVFGFASVELYALGPVIPFALLILSFDECRKYFLRKMPGGWVDRETFY